MRLLLDKGHVFIDLEAVDSYGDIALLAAASSHEYRIEPDSRFYRLLISRGAAVKARNSKTGESCLHHILSNRMENAETLIFLIKAGADVYAQDNRGRTVSEAAYTWSKRFGNPFADRASIPHIWESALIACGFDIEEFRKVFYSTLGPVIDTARYHAVWLPKGVSMRKHKVRNIYWVRDQDTKDEELEDEELEDEELEDEELDDEELEDDQLSDADADALFRRTKDVEGEILRQSNTNLVLPPLNWDNRLRETVPGPTNPWDSSHQLPSFDTFMGSSQLQDNHVVPAQRYEIERDIFLRDWTSPGPSTTTREQSFPDTSFSGNSVVSEATMDPWAYSSYTYQNHDWASFDQDSNVWR